jgi:hypothetical protein
MPAKRTIRYLHIMCGLRGCYLPDVSYIVAVTKRREIADIIRTEALCQAGEGEPTIGLDDHRLSWLTQAVWEGHSALLPWGYKPEGASKHHCGSGRWPRPYSIAVCPSSRDEYESEQRAQETRDAYRVIREIGEVLHSECDAQVDARECGRV